MRPDETTAARALLCSGAHVEARSPRRRSPDGGRGAQAARRPRGERRRRGRIVRVEGAGPGVVVFTSDTECDVLFESGVVRRMQPAAVLAHGGDVPRALQSLADDARVFAALREGERVRYEAKPGQVVEGTLREKCRWGALVVGGEGRAVAIGFRKLWPVAKGQSS
jgi:hypothetical protein